MEKDEKNYVERVGHESWLGMQSEKVQKKDDKEKVRANITTIRNKPKANKPRKHREF